MNISERAECPTWRRIPPGLKMIELHHALWAWQILKPDSLWMFQILLPLWAYQGTAPMTWVVFLLQHGSPVAPPHRDSHQWKLFVPFLGKT